MQMRQAVSLPKQSIVLSCMLLCGAVLSLTGTASAQSFYADDYRSLFNAPRNTAQVNAASVFDNSGAPGSNPANLLDISTFRLKSKSKKKAPPPVLSQQAELAYASFYQNVFHTGLLSYSASRPDGWAAGVSAAYLSIPGIPVNDTWTLNADGYPVEDASRTRTVSASIMFGNASCARLLVNRPLFRVAAGAAVHVIRQGLSEYSGYGIGSDLGVSASLPREGLKTSLLIENATTTYIRWSHDYSEQALPHVRLAFGWQKMIEYLYGRLQVTYSSLDFLVNEGVNATGADDQTSDTTMLPLVIYPSVDPVGFVLAGNWGLEYIVMERLALRLGLANMGRMSFGAGVMAWHQKLGFDFALLTHTELPQTYSASIRYAW